MVFYVVNSENAEHRKFFKVELENFTNLESISSRELPQLCITVGQRGHADAY